MALHKSCDVSSCLETISNIRFTSKEIDTLSCLMNGRSVKHTGQLLSMAPKTVETHIRSIKVKLDCSSKEQIISFAEKSEEYILVNKHYTELIINAEFEKLLKKIGDINIEVSFFRLKNNQNCERILNHFKICNYRKKHRFKANI